MSGVSDERLAELVEDFASEVHQGKCPESECAACQHSIDTEAALRELQRLRKAGLVAALEFYADERRYRSANSKPWDGDKYTAPNASYANCAERDRGDIARAAIAAATQERV